MTRIPIPLIAAALIAPGLNAQFQVSDHTARQVGIAVDALPTNAPLPSTFTINAPPGAPILVYVDATPRMDTPFGYGTPLVAPSIIELYGPTTLDITLSLTGAWPYTMPSTGTATFPIPNPIPAAPGTVWDFQAFMLAPDPAASNGVSISNGVRRTLGPVVGTAYTIGQTAIAGAYNDVEQGDVDGDGDLDVVLVGCSGGIMVHLTVGGVLRATPSYTLLDPTVTSCELVDLDNDNYLDLVVSQKGSGGGWIGNGGRPAPAPGTNQLGSWNGFRLNIMPFPLDLGLGDSNGNDIETADIDLDGDRDIVIACGSDDSELGEQNRLILNTTPVLPGAKPTFKDVTSTQYPPILDDSEDIEFFDLDGDLDDDIVVGNFDGPEPITGVDWYILNQGNGVYGSPTAFPGAPDDETLDVVIGDVNLDGAPDVYVANWYYSVGNQGGPPLGPPWGPPVADVLYMTVGGVPLSFTDASLLLPDSPLYDGDTPVEPAASVDAEISDYDLDGDLDIFVPIGTKCLFGAPSALGLRLLHNNLKENGIPGVMPPFVLDPAGWLPTGVLRDHSDIEMGDYIGVFHDQDFGAATISGFYSASRN